MKIRWLGVIRDVVIIWVLTYTGGFVIGLSGGQEPRGQLAIAASNFLFGIVGFTISGCIAKVARFKHLFVVAIGV